MDNTFLEKEGDINLLLNASNDNWFGQSIGPYQHLQIARFRAAEHQKYLVRVTSTGISALIGPDGKIIIMFLITILKIRSKWR